MGTFWIAMGVGALWTLAGLAIWATLNVSGALSRIEERAGNALEHRPEGLSDIDARMEALESRQSTLHEEIDHRWRKIAARDRRAQAVIDEEDEDLDEETARAALLEAAGTGPSQGANAHGPQGRRRLVPPRSRRRW